MAPIALLACGSSCHHLIEPAKPPLLRGEEGRPPLASSAAVRIENGYAAPSVVRLRADGIHKLEADLRQWSARLVSELELELRRRQVAIAAASPKSLRVQVVEVNDPGGGAGGSPLLAARIEGSGGDFTAAYAAGPAARDFAAAFLDIKEQILEDGRFQAWLGKEP